MSSKIIRSPIFSKFQRNVSSKLLIVRHGESFYQKALKDVHHLKATNPSEYSKMVNIARFNPELCDCDITEKGKKECFESGEQLELVRIKYVFVSPLMRALQSCEWLLKGYLDAIKKSGKSIKTPKVMVNPLIFEKIEDSCDFVPNIYRNMEAYKNYDWKEFKKLKQESLPIYMLNYCDTVFDATTNSPQISNENPYYKRCLSEYRTNLKFNHQEIILNAMKEINPAFIESSFKTYDRLLEFKTFLKKFSKESDLKKDEKILFVGHSIVFKHIFTNMIYEESFQPVEEDDNFIHLDNAQVASLYFDDEALFNNLKSK